MEDYTTHATTSFDPEVYIDTLYRHFTGDKKDDEFIKFILDSLQEVFKDGEITGERLLDVGTGPVCYSVFAASKWFKEIVLSDLADDNLAVLRRWKAGDIKHLESVFKYMIRLDGSKEDWIACNQRLARQVRAIVHCDLHEEDPLAGTEVEGVVFDAIILLLCQNAASLTPEQYRQSVLHYSRLLKPGGHIIVADPLEEDFYQIGEHRFKVLHATKEMLQSIYRECGYEILSWRQREYSGEANDYPTYMMVARKSSVS